MRVDTHDGCIRPNIVCDAREGSIPAKHDDQIASDEDGMSNFLSRGEFNADDPCLNQILKVRLNLIHGPVMHGLEVLLEDDENVC